jgi:putative endonuclease
MLKACVSNHQATGIVRTTAQLPRFDDSLGIRPHDSDSRPSYKSSMSAWIYILRCRDGAYYTGLTRGDPEARLAQHNSGILGGYTAKRRPVTLVFATQFDRLTDAIAFERQIKGWRRAKKEALIAGDFSALPELAKRTKRAVE